MRRGLAYRWLKRTAAAATIVLLVVTLISIKCSCTVWFPSRDFAGVQHGRLGWGEHGAEHGEWSMHVNVLSADLDWIEKPGPGTRQNIPALAGLPIMSTAFSGNWNRWIPLWWFLAPAAGIWLVLGIFDRKIIPGCCVKCGYDLEGVPTGDGTRRCPECGDSTDAK